ncbi:hypothetical protein HDV02_000674, partial [Globomyces sp. JEL0801]
MTSKRFLNVQYGLKPTRVNTTEMEDISEVVTAIKTYFGDDIQGPAARIQLWKKNDTENILIEDLDDIPNEYYLKPKNGEDNNRKSSRLLTTRKMSVEASCQKYLDAIAKRLTEFYEFDYRFKGGATIGDILEAKDGVEGEDWKFRRAVKTHYQTDDDGFTVEIRKGQPLTNNHLPDLYTPDEWDKISKFNKKTTKRVHDGQLPHLSNGKPYIIIPHSEFTVEMISFLKNI